MENTEANGGKLKILAIHGYRQNAEKFVEQTEPLRRLVNKWADFVYIRAPHKVFLVDNPDNLNLGEKSDEEQYGWFFNRDNRTNRGIRNGGPAIGYEETIRIIEEVFQKAGPFDGVLGFSQGACLTGLLCDLQHRGLLEAKFNFAIIISGFKSKALPHLKYYSEIINLPSMHVIGDNDRIIPRDMSDALSECFEDALIVRHTGGHIVPVSSDQKEHYENFVKTQYSFKNV
ncbi:hypothetical protein HHI36_021653 [Cryptolaemus montrouzieri]|uniref:Serine hydrolase domain-containing protein n=1 Tax=Cryptolaemus montrouzieri TaxID=559131 RepID=A0ABD2MXE0_9CUCU